MLVNVVNYQITTMQFDGVLDYRFTDFGDCIICAVICQPVATRSERNSILNSVADKIMQMGKKDVFVSADLDVYCDLGKNDADCNTLIQKLTERNCVKRTLNTCK